MKKSWLPILTFLFLIFVWEWSVKRLGIEKWLLPTPSDIFSELLTGWSTVSEHILPTITLSISGFLIGSTIGIFIAIVLHLIPLFRQAFYPLLIISQNIPIIVLAPLLVIWFGFGMMPKIIVISLVCFFPITIASLDGFRQTNRDFIHYMLMAGASKRQIFWKLEWPHSLPSLFSGLKISATYSVMGAVISEWLGASKGLGVYMTLSSSSFRTDRVFVAILLVIFLSLIFFALIVLIEKLVVNWKVAEEGNRHD